MNSYYSNLIEGHNTRPRDIERALTGAEIDPERRPLALEAKAHVEVQRMIDGLALSGELSSPISIEFIRGFIVPFMRRCRTSFVSLRSPTAARLR